MAPNLKELGLCDTVNSLFRDEILRAFFKVFGASCWARKLRPYSLVSI